MKRATPGFVILLAMLFVFVASLESARADSIVQFTYAGAVNGQYSVQVNSVNTPIAAATFLRYVNGGLYDNTILHRYDVIPNSYTTLAMEGGGYQLGDPLQQDVYPTLAPLNTIVPFAVTDNEAGASNTAGTIAMRRGSEPGSLTSRWDINIANNSVARDGPNSNYLVFGRIISGMSFLNSISLSPTNFNMAVYPLDGPDFYDNPDLDSVPVYVNDSYTQFTLLVVSSAVVVPAAWKGGSNSTGDWGVTSNWAGEYNNLCVPDGAGSKITLENHATAAKTIDMVSADRTVGGITFTGDATAIASSGQHELTLNNIDQPAVIDVSGEHSISAPLVLGGDAIITGTGTLNATGGITGTHQLMIKSGTLNATNISVDSLQIGDPPIIPLPAEWKGGAAANPTDWGVAANWINGVPNGSDRQAIFGNQLPDHAEVDLKTSDVIIGRLIFNDGTSTTIISSGQHTLTLDQGLNVAEIEVAGTHTISVPVILADDTRISGTGTLHLSGGIAGAFALDVVGTTVNATSISVDSLRISSPSVNAVPEPSALALFAIGFAGLLAFRCRRK